MAGVVEAVYRDATTPFFSFIVMRDVAVGADGKIVYDSATGKPTRGSKGWTYKHVHANDRVSKDAPLEEGVVIGAVGMYPGANGYGDHVHLDRGLAAPEPRGGATPRSNDGQFMVVQIRKGLDSDWRHGTSPG